MTRTLMVLALAVGLAGLSQAEPPAAPQAEPLTAAQARESADSAVDMLVEINSAIVDEYFHSGEWEKSVSVLDRVIGLRPTEINAYANAAWLLWSTDQIDRAMGYYKLMIKNNPTNPDGYYTIGHYFFFTRRNYQEALPYLQKAAEYNGPVMQQHLYAHCLEKVGRTEDALAAWRKILAAHPEDEVAKREIDRLVKGAPEAPAAKEEQPEAAK